MYYFKVKISQQFVGSFDIAAFALHYPAKCRRIYTGIFAYTVTAHRASFDVFSDFFEYHISPHKYRMIITSLVDSYQVLISRRCPPTCLPPHGCMKAQVSRFIAKLNQKSNCSNFKPVLAKPALE
jgi:hypothetical protein